MLEGPLRFPLSRCLYVCMDEWFMDVGFSSTKKVNFSKESAMTDSRKTWYVGSGGRKYYPWCTWSVVTKCAYLLPHLHICSADWLITKKTHIQSSVWATVTIDDSDETWNVGSAGHKYYPHGLSSSNVRIYLFWLANNKKGKYSEFFMGYSDQTWYVDCGGQKCYQRGLSLPNVHI